MYRLASLVLSSSCIYPWKAFVLQRWCFPHHESSHRLHPTQRQSQESNSPASEFISAESCSNRLQLCSVFSQSHLIVSNFLSIQFNSLDAFHVSTLSLLGLVLLRLLPIPIRQINSKQRCCILLVTRFQLVSSGLLVKLLVGIQNLLEFWYHAFNALSTLFLPFSSALQEHGVHLQETDDAVTVALWP